MPDKLHKTKGIVLRTVKYGETSVVVTIYTEVFGLQGYLVNGVRTHSKKGPGKAALFQPGAILDLVVYHHESKHLNRLREFRWSVLYQHILGDVMKNAIALYMIEVFSRCLKQPESNPDLYAFLEDALLHLDIASPTVAANYPLFFALHLPYFLGFRVDDNYSATNQLLDLEAGIFVSALPGHPYFLDEKQSQTASQLLKVRQPGELESIRLNQESRRNLLIALENYYALHVQDFGKLKTLPVLREILG